MREERNKGKRRVRKKKIALDQYCVRIRPTQRSNRRPLRRPYTQHAQRLHQRDNTSIRRRENVQHRRTESSPAATLPPRGVFGLLSSFCRNLCVIGHSTATTDTAPVPGAGVSHSALPADHTMWHNRTATPIVMRSPEAEMQRVMRTNLLSLLSFRDTRKQACRRCDHYGSSIRTATGQGSYCQLTASGSPCPPLLSRRPTTTPALPTERI
ncbi:hypothetical protein TCDM_07508 [Trypanosoma cruzi Dm28c]|uniref:Uncharacterized protein n=1 Tax=Trypanosoma cruzi Dm28c TaxID=1416333 RepID=V5B9V6_TRYCR|nr:hypothetical protein TCDM_07508 [Trypanosoma cruzi Dm28c]